jgi:hypothetical protein
MPSTRLMLVTLFITLITIIGIFNCLYTAQASVPSPEPPRTTPQAIGGRWQLVHSSLGLEPLPATIAISVPTAISQPSHRIDFRRRKRSAPAPLHFARDALREPRVSLKELVVSFRRIAHEEAKADAARSETKKGRSRLGRSSVRKGQLATPSH